MVRADRASESASRKRPWRRAKDDRFAIAEIRVERFGSVILPRQYVSAESSCPREYMNRAGKEMLNEDGGSRLCHSP
jgi:hypothetical protein